MHSVVMLNETDAPDMAKIHNVCIEYQAWSVDVLKDFLTNPQWGKVYTFGVREGTQLQGYILGRDLGDYAEILDFAVMPHHREQGVGEALLKHLLESIATRPFLLEMKIDNRAAQRLYKQYNFQVIRTIPNYYQCTGRAFDAVLMKLS